MSLNLEQAKSLVAALGVSIPPEYLRQKELEAEFAKRCAGITAEFGDFKAHHSAARAEELFNNAGMLAGREKDFERALALLDELEVLLRSPAPPPKPPIPTEQEEAIAEAQENEKLDTIAKGKGPEDDPEAVAKEWTFLKKVMGNLEGRFLDAVALLDAADRLRASLEAEQARLNSVVEKRSGKPDVAGLDIKLHKTSIEAVLKGPVPRPQEPPAAPVPPQASAPTDASVRERFTQLLKAHPGFENRTDFYRIDKALNAAGEHGKQGDFAAANTALDEAEQLLNSAPPKKEEALKAYKERVHAVIGKYPDFRMRKDGKAIADKLEEADWHASKEGFARAYKLLDEVDSLLAGSAPSGEKPVIPVLPASPPVQQNPVGAKLPVVEVPRPAESKEDLQGRLAGLDARYQQALKVEGADAGKLKGLMKKAISSLEKNDLAAAKTGLTQLEGLIGAALAMETKTKTQQARQTELKNILAPVKKTYLPNGMAAAYGKEKLKPGKEFKAFLDALKKFEANRSLKTLEALEKACHVYLKHYHQDLKPKQQQDKESLRKKAICETTLKAAYHWRLADEASSLPNPPWDFETENKAGEIHAKVNFEDGNIPAKPLVDENKGACESWFLQKTTEFSSDPSKPAAKTKSTFIFKPADAEVELGIGWPKGGGAPREVMGKAVSDQLQVMTGINPGVCPTNLAKIDNGRLPTAEGKADEKQAPLRLGAMQELADNSGSIGKKMKDDPNYAAKIPKENYDEVAVLDLLTFNVDRHAGNLLMDEQPGQPPKMVPIDHGLSLPGRDAMSACRFRLTSEQNTLASMPQKDEKLSENVRAKLEQLDPDKLADEMRKSNATLVKLHPEMKGTISEENVEMTRRAAQFLKKAAAYLTVEELFDAYAYFNKRIFDAKDKDVDKMVKEVVALVKKRTKEMKEADTLMDLSRLNSELTRVQELGWCLGFSPKPDFDHFLKDNPDKVLKILRGRIPNPAVVAEINKLVKQLGGPDKLGFDLKGMPFNRQLERMRSAAKGPVPKAKGEASLAEKQKQIEKLGGAKALAALKALCTPQLLEHNKPEVQADLQLEALTLWKEFEKLGGTKELFRLGGTPGESIANTLDVLQALQAIEEPLKSLDAVPERDVAAQQKKFVTELLASLRQSTGQLLNPNTRSAHTAKLDTAADFVSKDKLDEAQKILNALRTPIETDVIQEQNRTKILRQAAADLDKRFKDLPASPDRDKIEPLNTGFQGSLEKSLAEGKLDELEIQQRRLETELDRAKLGDAAPIAKLEKRIKTVRERLEAKPELLQNADIKREFGEAEKAMATAVLPTVESNIGLVETRIRAADLADRIKAAETKLSLPANAGKEALTKLLGEAKSGLGNRMYDACEKAIVNFEKGLA